MVAIGGGLVAGIAFSKLMCMLLYAMIGYHAEIVFYVSEKYSLQGTTQGNGLTGGVPPVRFSM